MLTLKVVRECDIKEIHDLPKPTFGLEKYVETVATLIISEDSNADPRYVGVWGMGGVGKTLLLQTLYASEKVHGHFQGAKFIWRTVGQTPNIMALYRSLSKELGEELEMDLNAEDYKLKLHSLFRLRQVFLVLDDIWQDETFDSLDLAKGKRSVTLLSTRNQSLFRTSSSHIKEVQMIRLSKEDSWSLFCVHAFRHLSHVPYELEELAQSVAEECQGLPLALKVIGTAMKGKMSPELDWELPLKKLRESRMQERPVEEKLYERLKIGYDDLAKDDVRLKDCFLYFAAFPEDSDIVFESILWHWIGEGLVPAHDEDDPKADAFSLLTKLWERSLIDRHGEEGWDNLYFTVHDVMRDLAFYILEKDCGACPAKQLYLYRPGQNLEEIPREWKTASKALKLSLMENNLKTLPCSFYAPELLSLQLSGNPIESVPASFFSNFQNLRVLNLSYGLFHSLPEELGDLKNLIYLDLFYCFLLQTLPDTVGKLHMLNYLDIRVCWMLDLPHEIFGLTSLQVLHTMGCNVAWFKQTSLAIRAETLGEECSSTRASSGIWGLVGLTELSLSGARDSEVEDDGLLPHDMSALTNLKRLRLQLNLETLPAEMPYWFKQLQELQLCDSVIFPSSTIPSSFTHCGAFPSLIRFQLSSCKTLVEFPEVHEGALPRLRTLELICCESLRTLPLSLELLTNLRKLILSECDGALRESCTKNCEESSRWRNFDLRYNLLMSHRYG
jgi:disease resistance protein RPS2